MSGTRRTPLARRPALARITPAALEAFPPASGARNPVHVSAGRAAHPAVRRV